MGTRPLTAGEIELCRSVFGDAIDYSQVELYDEPHNPLQGEAVTAPDGNIYYPEDSSNYSRDISQEPLVSQGLFIHEMAHVWQYQTGRSLFVEKSASYMAARLESLLGVGLDNAGGPVIDDILKSLSDEYNFGEVFNGTAFEDLRLEQQAEFIQWHFLLRESAKTDTPSFQPFYEKMAAQMPRELGGAREEPLRPVTTSEQVLGFSMDLSKGISSATEYFNSYTSGLTDTIGKILTEIAPNPYEAMNDRSGFDEFDY